MLCSSVPFGRLANGREVTLYRLQTVSGCVIEILNYGAVIAGIWVPDCNAELANVVLRYPTLADYENDTQYVGALVGRYANRIATAQFNLAGHTVNVDRNHGQHHLHGGDSGFHQHLYDARVIADNEACTIELRSSSPADSAGFPGRCEFSICYTLNEAAHLCVEYRATTDATTVINLTQHSYFNLSGTPESIRDHTLKIDSEALTPVDADNIPTGEIKSVVGSVFDLREARRLGDILDSSDPEVRRCQGLDHNWVLNGGTPAIVLTDLKSKRQMSVSTTEPGVQIYTGNALSGQTLGPHQGICIETQHFPDSPNQAHFPSTRLEPGEAYYSKTDFSFGLVAGSSQTK